MTWIDLQPMYKYFEEKINERNIVLNMYLITFGKYITSYKFSYMNYCIDLKYKHNFNFQCLTVCVSFSPCRIDFS